ncbi:DNA cytosine methyltransferase [Carboxydothermus ferrireducens]|nr:DNA cytosine methyltransferase [Carboxydothermus ferrireducens]
MGELFCGAGGLALGAKEAKVKDYRIEHVWANDIDYWACETFRKNICPEKPEIVIWGDVRELKIEDLPQIDAFAFGFPCNDFSIVGEQRGLNGNYGPLYSYGVKVLKIHRPLFFVAENVSGLKSANEGYAFTKILNELEKAGTNEKQYELTIHLYKFEEYGVPQRRHRIIIVGIRKDLGLKFKVPAPTHKGNYISAKKALENIPEDAPNQEKTKHSPKVIELLKHIPPGKNAWCEEVPLELRLNVKGAKLSQIYRRLHPDEPAYTITGSGGGGTHVYHWTEPRALTNRERARLQTFPDYFEFLGPKEQVRKQIGMAVPPKASKIIFEAVLKTFAGESYPYVEENKGDYYQSLFDFVYS